VLSTLNAITGNIIGIILALEQFIRYHILLKKLDTGNILLNIDLAYTPWRHAYNYSFAKNKYLKKDT